MRATVAGSGIRVAVYRPDMTVGESTGYQVRLFKNAEPRRFGVAVIKPEPGEYGVCVLAGEMSRIACTRVVIAANRNTATSTLLDIDDPLVTKEVDAAPYSGDIYPPPPKGAPTPTCGTCF